MGMNVARYKAASAPVVSAARSETPTPLERRAQKFPSSSTLHAAPGGGRCPPAPSPSLVGEPHHTHYLSGCRQKAPHNISTYSTHSLGKLDAPTVPVNGVFLPVITGVFKPVIGAQSNLEVFATERFTLVVGRSAGCKTTSTHRHRLCCPCVRSVCNATTHRRGA